MHTEINKADVQHLTDLIENNGLPALKNLSLREENWVNSNNELELLKTACRAKIGFKLYLNGHRVKKEERKTSQVKAIHNLLHIDKH